jgi:hypothetical protein
MGTARLWAVGSRRARHSDFKHRTWVNGAAFNRDETDSDLGGDGKVRLWPLEGKISFELDERLLTLKFGARSLEYSSTPGIPL